MFCDLIIALAQKLIDNLPFQYYNQYMRKIWKVLKVVLMVLIVAGAVAGTCYFFYAHLRDNLDIHTDVDTFVYGGRRDQFNAHLDKVSQYADDRFILINTTLGQLDTIAVTLDHYFIDIPDADIDQQSLVDQMTGVNEQLDTAYRLADEYLVKTGSSEFDLNAGANDLFRATSRLFVMYADLLSNMNSEISNLGVDKSGDVKFDMIDVYLDVVVDTFSDLTSTSGLANVTNADNINLMNTYFAIENGQIRANGGYGNYSHMNNNFMKYYSSCDKHMFAINLSTNVNAVHTITEGSSDMDKAVYYFKKVLGI